MRYRSISLGGAAICAAALCLWASFASPSRSSQDEDLLELVYAGCSNAVSAVQTGKGLVIVRESSVLARGVPEPVQETESTYELLFAADKYQLSIDTAVLRRDLVPGEQFPPSTQQAAGGRRRSKVEIADNQITEFIPENKTATIRPKTVSTLHSTLMRLFSHSGRHLIPTRGLLDIRGYVKQAPPDSHPDVRIAGRELVDGTECILLEMSISPSFGGKIVHLLWVSPERGFTILRARKFAQYPGSTDRILTDEEDVEVKDYGSGTWYPTRVTKKYYRGNDKGEPYVFSTTVITYDPGFQINTGVSEGELSLKLPAGTRVYDHILDAIYAVP